MDREKIINELNDCLENQHISFIDGVGDVYAVSEETIKNIIELLKNLGDLENKYTSLLKEKISELIEENAKLNLEMSQAISERSIYTIDRW